MRLFLLWWSKLNVVDVENMDCVINSTKHICGNRNQFLDYTLVGEGEDKFILVTPDMHQ